MLISSLQTWGAAEDLVMKDDQPLLNLHVQEQKVITLSLYSLNRKIQET